MYALAACRSPSRARLWIEYRSRRVFTAVYRGDCIRIRDLRICCRAVIGYAAYRVVGAAVPAAMAVWFGTPLLFYMYVAPGFSHACSAFAVAAFVVAWLRVRRDWSWGGVAALGALAALMGMVREQDLFIAIGPAVDYLVTFARNTREGERSTQTMLARAGVGIVTLAVCFLPQLLAYRILTGDSAPRSLSSRK